MRITSLQRKIVETSAWMLLLSVVNLAGACASSANAFRHGWTVYASASSGAYAFSPAPRVYYPISRAGIDDPVWATRSHDEWGESRDCGSPGWVCLDGPGIFVIPADDGLERWTYEDISCERLADRRIACTEPRGETTTFEFDRARGVLAFSVDGHPEQRFYRGTPLLAPGS